MGNTKGPSSWLTVVKRAFRSPTKDTQNKINTRRSTQDNDQQQDEDDKKRDKRRWLFRKHSTTQPNEANKLTHFSPAQPPNTKTPQVLPTPDHSHAIAVAAATAAAAEAAVATAQAAVEIIRLTRSSNPSINNTPITSIKQQNNAAILIQKAFRGYLARRALVALRGIVKLQALIRGQNVRKQAKMTLRCMQALLRLQTRMHDHHHHTHQAPTTKRLSQDGGGRKSMFAESTNNFFWDSKYIAERRSMSRDRRGSNSSIDWNWNDCPRTLEELEERLQSRKEAAALKRETSSSSSLAHANSQKIWNAEENGEVEERTNWLEQWMETKQQWEDDQEPFLSRVSTDKRDSFVKTVEMDRNMNNAMTPKQANVRKMNHHYHKQSPHSACPSPGRGLKANMAAGVHPPSTPSPSSKPKPSAAMRTPSPRSLGKEDRSYSAANTPSLRSTQRLNSSCIPRYSYSVGNGINHNINNNNAGAGAGSVGLVPNYMAATESAKARVRSQSAPRQRPSTPERDHRGGGGGAALAKKRLSFPVPPAEVYASCTSTCNTNLSYFSQSLRSPSFKSVQAGYVGMEQQSSCYTDSINGGEISPCSTTELRWWLR